jgi:hypothetical protein
MKVLDRILPIEIQNKNDGQGRHWSGMHKTRRRMETDLRMLGLVRQPFEFPVSVLVTRILGKGQRFWDSSSVLRGTYKSLEDSLVACGWFHDDSRKYITNTFGIQDGNRRHLGPSVRIEVFTEEFPPCATPASVSKSKPEITNTKSQPT